jgi:hypothetical protein
VALHRLGIPVSVIRDRLWMYRPEFALPIVVVVLVLGCVAAAHAGGPAQTVVASGEESFVSAVFSLLQSQLVNFAFVLCGMLFGIGCVALLKRFSDLAVADDATPEVKSKQVKKLQAYGYLFGGVWTFVAMYGHLSGLFIDKINWSVGATVIGSALTPKLYDLLDWTWTTLRPAACDWVLRKLGKKDDQPPPPGGK